MKTFRTLSFATLYFFLLNATSIAQVYQTISTYAGPPIPFEGTRGFAGDGGPATSALLNDPKAVAVDTAGSLYIADTGNHRIRKVASNGIITTIAGSGTIGFSGDGGPAVAAELNFPQGVAVDSAGNVFIADTANFRVRKVTIDGIITTVAGGGDSIADGVGGTAFRLPGLSGITVDSRGNLYIADPHPQLGRIRKLSPDGIITTLPGNYPGAYGVAVDAAGNLFISQIFGQVLKLRPDGTIQNVSVYASLFPGIPRIPTALALDVIGNLYVSDANLMRILKFGTDNSVSFVVGSLSAPQSFSGEGELAINAGLGYPQGLAIDAIGNIYVAEASNRVRKITPIASQVFFSTFANTGWTLQTSGGMEQTVTGYARIHGDATGQALAGLAIFGLRENGVLATETSVPASVAIQRGRIFAEVNGALNTGLALANPNDQPLTVSFFFTDSRGDSNNGELTIPANGQVSAFLDQPPFNGPSSFVGTLTFNSTLPIAAIALRGLVNGRGEFLMTTLPVADLTTPSARGTFVFPYFADGGGWTSQIVLVNPGDVALSGTVQFLDQAGQSAAIDIDGQSKSSLSYLIAPKSFQRFRTAGRGSSPFTGSVRVVPTSGAGGPAGLLVFSFRPGDVIVTEAGVAAVPSGMAFRLYAEMSQGFSARVPGSVQSGVAIANNSVSPADITIQLMNMDGFPLAASRLSIPAGGQKAFLVNDVPGFSSLQMARGVLRVTSPTPISVMGLRARYNERGEFLITTTPATDEAAERVDTLYFPQLADSGGFTTQFIVFSTTSERKFYSGTVQFVSPSGTPLSLNLR